MRQREIVDVDEGSVSGHGGAWRRDLGGAKVQAYPVPARLEVDQGLEIGIVNWPASRREASLMVVNRQCAVQRFALRLADLAENQQYLLMYLRIVSITQDA